MKFQISDFLSILALIVSIGSILIQNIGVNKQLLISNINEYTKRYEDIIKNFPAIVIDDNFDINKLPIDEQETILCYMLIYFNLCYEEYILFHDLKLIDKKLWSIWKDAMEASFSRPSFRQCWIIVKEQSTYPRSFINFVNKIINIKL